MSHTKRSHKTYEADLYEDQLAAHVSFGTPLPPLDPDTRDDGSYVPLHKQQVRDEHGRRRLHGAFTGGWSAGYFNTVGSKEGWTPSTFISSRTNRQKGKSNTFHHRPEDYMDEEDLADATATQEIRTTDPFAALGASSHVGRYPVRLAGLMRRQCDSMGFELLRRMGWKDGQGIGPKVRRKARLGASANTTTAASNETHLFAPDDVVMVTFSRKANQRGLGYREESPLSQLSGSNNNQYGLQSLGADLDKGGGDSASGPRLSLGMPDKKQKQAQRGGFGVGILNDTGSDEDDPYEMGPRISYNRTLGSDKMKKKQSTSTTVAANPALRTKPVFVSKSGSARVHVQPTCLDGKPLLKGFVMGHSSEPREIRQSVSCYPPPTIPPEWVSGKRRMDAKQPTAYASTKDAAKAACHDPRSRAAILGEPALPGKSVFDYMSTASRERLAAFTGRSNLPPAKGEVLPEHGKTAEQRLQDRLQSIPTLSKETAIAAMSRGAGAGGPYANDEAKRARYRLYLQSAAGFGGSTPTKPQNMTDNDYIKEIEEFHGCAQLFKPMTGFMATRFTTASTGSNGPGDPGSSSDSNVQKLVRPPKPADPFEEAAKMGMYGRMTRLTENFFPTRLLCKRFSVPPPAHVQPDLEPGVSSETRGSFHGLPASIDMTRQPLICGMDANGVGDLPGPKPADDASKTGDKVAEASRPSDDVFKAIFGDSSDEE
ncbi:G-patch domain containing protein [Colletotrichum higginsianum IMI 349063]|uniref:G-patch domain containing protein n=2 Tax=Colletotrichum higginsianum (strain IMI 349063) TaxID=759273 RepID=A0A1B7XT50_COLHI|nr:G-patch domain containing protein [Colletotrichum higginsianum IMI 349063]OBR02942.1 G-patch domain containing protein [Colletotrichum higginsianum IMI 349063]